MRLILLKIVPILLIAGSSDARPQQIEVSSSLQPKIEGDNTEGWRPVQQDANVAQESIPVGKDLPQIVEGNSRYTEESGAKRRKSYVINNLFYEDYIPVLSNDKTSDSSHEQVDVEAFKSFKSKVFNKDIKRRAENDEVTSNVKISFSNTVDKNETEGTLIKIIDLKNKDLLNRTVDERLRFVIDEVPENTKSNSSLNVTKNLENTVSVSQLGSKNFSGANKSTNPATYQRKKMSSRYRGEIGSRLLSLENPTNVDSLLNFNPDASYSEQRTFGIESQTRIVDYAKDRLQITLNSRAISGAHKDAHVNKEKVTNFVEIKSSYDGFKNSTNKTTALKSSPHDLHNIQNQVFRMDLVHPETGVKNSDSNFSEIVIASQEVADQTIKHQLDSKNSTKNLIRIKPQANGWLSHLIERRKDYKADASKHSKNGSKNSVRHKPNSNQSNSVSNLKNWPNGNLESVEDVFNYEKYTSLYNGEENLEEQENTEPLVYQENLANIHEVTSKPEKLGPKPSILIFDHSSSSREPVKNTKIDIGPVYDPESHVNIEQNAQNVVHWAQIHPFITHNGDFLVTADTNEAESNGLSPIYEALEPNRPSDPEHEQAQSNNYYGYVDESLPGEKPAAQIAQNYEDHLIQGQEYVQNQHKQPYLENPNFGADVTRPTSETIESEGTYNDYQQGLVHTPDLSKQPYLMPTSIVSQNTVVHILNTGEKRPNVTVDEMKVSPENSSGSSNPKDRLSDGKNSSVSTPNVHIMFTMQEDKTEESDSQYGPTVIHQKPEVTYDDSMNCPTITINSYTRINNTVQGKEGCTDLNIIINSHVLNTNVFNRSPTTTGNYGPENNAPNERYPGYDQSQPSYATSDSSYGTFTTGSGQNTGGSVPGDFQNFPVTAGGQNLQSTFPDGQFGQQSPGTSIFEVFQQTQINVGSQNDIPDTENALDPGSPNAPAGTGTGVETESFNEPGVLPETGVSNDPINLTEVADDPGVPGVAGDPGVAGVADDPGVAGAADDPGVGGIADDPGVAGIADDPGVAGIADDPGVAGIADDPGVAGVADDPGVAGIADDPVSGGGDPSFPPVDDIQAPLGDSPADAAADTPLSPGNSGSSGQSPGGNNPLSGLTDQFSDAVGNLGSQDGNGESGADTDSGSPGSILGDDDDDDDDDEDDEGLSDLVPFSIIESMTSMLPYFTLLNPLNYGFLSFAISPFAVGAAGLFGLAAALIPYAFPGAFDFGRAADKVTIRLRPSVEELVKQSIQQYENWNEWKSKRKKRKK